MIQPDEQIIWRYLDGDLDEIAQRHLEKRMAEDPSLKTLFDQISAVDSGLRSQSLEQPSLRFSKTLMEKIQPPKKSVYRPLIPAFTQKRISAAVVALSFFSILISVSIPVVYNEPQILNETFASGPVAVFLWAVTAFWGVIFFDQWKTGKIFNHF
ncbi:MAG: hypothetical protein SF052_09820 [Bacteroidia bacterium]|nr:hypothetical protein [Bacteroidia bacterium]